MCTPRSRSRLYGRCGIGCARAVRLSTIDESDREILMLRAYEELSYQEIADVRRIPLNTVRSQLFRARMALKTALEARTPETVRSSHGDH